MPLISYNYSSGNHKRMKDTILFALRLMLPAMIAVSACYYVFAGGLIRLFMDNETIVAYGTRFLRALCLAQPLIYMDFLAVGVFQALGLGKNALIFAIMRKIILEIPALFILNRLFPLYGLPYAQPAAEMVLAIAAAFMLKGIFQRTQKETET